MPPGPQGADDDPRGRLASIREEMRFEIAVFHERVNALIGAEAFLLISFTSGLAYTGRNGGTVLFWVSPTLAAIGFTLAALAWPGVVTSYRIIVEWNVVFVEALNAARGDASFRWRPSVFVTADRRIQADHRRSMLFQRYVPAIFMVAWAVLAGIVFLSR